MAEFAPLETLNAPRFPRATPANQGGRPSEFDPVLGERALAGMREGRSLRRICREDSELPAESTIREWAFRNPEFGAAYRAARDLGLDAMADETLDVSDDSRNDTQIDPETGQPITNFDHINRARLRVDTRKWYLSKLAPKRYGDSSTIAHTGPDGGPIQSVALTASMDNLAEEQREQLRALLLLATQPKQPD